MSAHLTEDELRDFVTHKLPPPQIAAAARHLGECSTCAAAARAGYDVDAAAQSVMSDLTADEPLPMRWRVLMLAALLAVCVAGLSAWIVRVPQRLPSDGVDRWSRVVMAARSEGRLPMPDVVRALRPGAGALRGPTVHAAVRLRPFGVVVESDRPLFQWQPVPGVIAYRVLLARGPALVMATPPIGTTSWRPDRPLERGATYSWQLVAIRPEGEYAFPMPPNPPALFRVLSREEQETIRAAWRAHPGDRLLFGVLYARAGLADDAEAELAVFAAAHPNDRVARSLLQSVRDWQAHP